MSSNGDVESGSSVPDLDLDIAEIDDKDFTLPPAEKTLVKTNINDDESVISEDDIPNYLHQELLNPGFDDKGETGSVSSVGSKGANCIFTHKKLDPLPNILRHVVLKVVSAHLQLSGEGDCTAMAVGCLIGIGTSTGAILCYEKSQKHRWTHNQPEDGPVTAIAINTDSTRLLAGYALGLVLMLDTADAKVLRVISPESHTLSTAVLHVKFTDIPSLALLSDSGGSVFEISLKRVLGVRSWDSRCIFSGSRGEVVAVEPLLLNKLPTHPLAGSLLVAVATLSKVLLISLRPGTRLLFTQSLRSVATTLPLLSWQFVVIQVADSMRVMDPVLAVARHESIFFYQVSVERSGRLSCHGLHGLTLNYSAMACHWLSPRTIAVLDTESMLHLVDVRTKAELQVADLSGIGLVFNSFAFEGACTGGNVSKAMALAGKKACYNSVASFGNQLLLLEPKALHVISIRFWSERIDNLIKANRFEEALKLGMNFYEEREKAVLGLKGTREIRRMQVKEKVVDTLSKFIDNILADDPEINLCEAIPLVVEYCLDLDQKDLIFDKLWNGLNDGRSLFLESMEAAILEGKLVQIPPEVMQRLVSFQQSKQSWDILEECIQRVEVTCLDIEQVIKLCKKQNLYSALISVWNRAMSDYTSPIIELVPKLKSFLTNEGSASSECRRLGNLLLVYVASCLSGSLGEEKGERAQVVRAMASQHSLSAPDDEPPFPYIRTLLEFDSREFLNALVIAFSDTGLSMTMKQRLVDIIIQVMTDGTSFRCTDIARALTTLRSSTVGRSLRMEASLYTDTVSRLVTEEEVPAAERESALLQLFLSGALSCLEHDVLLEFAKSANFYQVCSVIHERRGDYGEVLKSQLADPNRREHVFSFFEQSPHKHDMGILEPENMEALLKIDAKKTGQLLVRHIPESISDIITKLSEEQLYPFLQGMIEESDLDTEHMTRYVCLMCRFEPHKVLQVVKSHDNIELDPAIKVCQERGLDEVTAVLLERSGDVQGAFNVLLSRLQTAIKNEEKDTERMTEELVSLAQRGSTVLDSKTSWMPLLMCLLKLNSTELLQRVLNNADLNLVSELHLLMQHSRGTLGELRALIMGLFVKCRHQKRMLEATKRLHMSGLHGELAVALDQAKVGCRSPLFCHICSAPFSSGLYLFRCGHGYHEECILPNTKCIECYKDS
ncbi:unnamed protein product [Nezara viridula]|uniref:RING-type domain-containing protein n=1 Tax=Nezara viridula TaxID=85310 RepID=A0A9P0HQN1_NEZVI|nr:unnamed protein product [Nezara viridula]